MVLEGVVTNVAAFGAFVDVGVHQDGLVHVSAMSTTVRQDPRDVVKSGDVVRVKVLEVDVPRKRISLTLRLDDEPGAAAKPERGERVGARREPGRGDQGRGDRAGVASGGAQGPRAAGPARQAGPGSRAGAPTAAALPHRRRTTRWPTPCAAPGSTSEGKGKHR